jgi:hypothetical protein
VRPHDRSDTSIEEGHVSYLLQYARRPLSIATRSERARVDERIRLNRPGLYGDAYVRVFVEDTTARNRRRDGNPRLTLRIADCANTINLEFDLATAVYRENSLFKIDTLLHALNRFRDALAAEAEVAERRDNSRRRGGAR